MVLILKDMFKITINFSNMKCTNNPFVITSILEI